MKYSDVIKSHHITLSHPFEFTLCVCFPSDTVNIDRERGSHRALLPVSPTKPRPLLKDWPIVAGFSQQQLTLTDDSPNRPSACAISQSSLRKHFTASQSCGRGGGMIRILTGENDIALSFGGFQDAVYVGQVSVFERSLVISYL